MADARMLGLQALKARIASLPSQVVEPVRAQLKKETDGLVDAMKEQAPSSELESHEGELRDSIHAYDNPDKDLSERIVCAPVDDRGKVYSAHVEYGHLAGGHGKEGRRHVPAQPFFWPTYRAMKKGIRRRMSAAGRRAVKAAFPKDSQD